MINSYVPFHGIDKIPSGHYVVLVFHPNGRTGEKFLWLSREPQEFDQICTGALFNPEWVITPALCADTNKNKYPWNEVTSGESGSLCVKNMRQQMKRTGEKGRVHFMSCTFFVKNKIVHNLVFSEFLNFNSARFTIY